MKRAFVALLSLGLFTLGGVHTGSGQEIVGLLGNQFGVGARSLGMGGAHVGLAEDYSAAYWNPAGLGLIRRMEFYVSFSHLNYRDESSFFGHKAIDQSSFTKLNAFGFAYPVPTYRGSLVFAIGFNRMRSFDGSFSFEGFRSTPGDSVWQAGEEYETGGLHHWALAGAVEVAKDLFVGASLNLWGGSDEYSWEFRERDILDIWTFQDYLERNTIRTDLDAFNVTLGGLYRLNKFLRLGATVSTPVTFFGKENWTYESQTLFDNLATADSSDGGYYEYKIQSPFTLSFGASISLPLLVLAGDLEFNDWSQMRYKFPQELDRENRLFRKAYRQTVRVRLGAEFMLPLIEAKLRAGLMYDPKPYRPGQTLVEETIPDKLYLTTGVGFLLAKRFMLDVALVQGWWERQSDVYKEDVRVSKIFITGAYRF